MKLQIDPRWKWAAMDRGGDWYAFTEEPKKGEYNSWYCSNNKQRGMVSLEIFVLARHENWQDSLHRIENGELIKHKDQLEQGKLYEFSQSGSFAPDDIFFGFLQEIVGKMYKDNSGRCYAHIREPQTVMVVE